MKTKISKTVSLFAAFALLFGVSALALTASADDNQENNAPRVRQEREAFFADINREVTNIDNGVEITLTSDNEEAVEFLQNRPEREPKNENVTRTIENLDNGIKITITSDDEEEIAKIQEHSKNQQPGMNKGRGKRGGNRDDGCAGGAFFADINREVTNIDNGVEITLTSDNEEAVEFLQNRPEREPKNENVTRTIENLDNGIKITITSDDEEEIAKIQEHTEPEEMGMRRAKKRPANNNNNSNQ